MTLGNIVAKVTLNNTVAFDIIFAFVDPLVARLTSSPLCCVMSTFGILVCYEECIILILLGVIYALA
jgi:hypothetical protein